VIITPSESILIYSWIITNFQKHACFKQFVWTCYNIFASLFALGVLFRTCSFICLRLFCHNRSFLPVWRLSILRANLASTEKLRPEKSGSLYLGRLGLLCQCFLVGLSYLADFPFFGGTVVVASFNSWDHFFFTFFKCFQTFIFRFTVKVYSLHLDFSFRD